MGVYTTLLERSHTHNAMPPFVLTFHADHSTTCETPTGLDFEQRVEAHCVAIRAALAGAALQLRIEACPSDDVFVLCRNAF